MLNNKKTMLIGLIIGFGTGLFVSGIIISILFYTSPKENLKTPISSITDTIESDSIVLAPPNKEVQVMPIALNESKSEPKIEPEVEPKIEPKAEPKVEPKVEPKIAPPIVQIDKAQSNTGIQTDLVDIQEKDITASSDKFIEVTIQPRSSASTIAKLLMEKGVVEDADALIQYIKSQGKTTKLLTGKKVFSTHADLEAILDVLTTKQ